MGDMADWHLDQIMAGGFWEEADERCGEDSYYSPFPSRIKEPKQCKFCGMDNLWWGKHDTDDGRKWKLFHRDGRIHSYEECTGRQKLQKIRATVKTDLPGIEERLKSAVRDDKSVSTPTVRLTNEEAAILVVVLHDLRYNCACSGGPHFIEPVKILDFDQMFKSKEK